MPFHTKSRKLHNFVTDIFFIYFTIFEIGTISLEFTARCHRNWSHRITYCHFTAFSHHVYDCVFSPSEFNGGQQDISYISLIKTWYHNIFIFFPHHFEMKLKWEKWVYSRKSFEIRIWFVQQETIIFWYIPEIENKNHSLLYLVQKVVK